MESKTICGYVQAVSPTKKSRKTSVPYFNFLLQTTNSQFRKAVCYDDKQRKEFCSFKNSRSPAKIRNVSEKRSLLSPDDLDIIVSMRNRLLTATNSEVDYDFAESSKEALSTISEILQVEPGQLVTTCGCLTISPTEVKDITINGATLSCNETGILTDNTASLPITIWGTLHQTLKNGVTYKLGPLRIKNYQVKRLSTTPSTTAIKQEMEFPEPEVTFTSAVDIQEVEVKSINLAEDFKPWFSCRQCGKALTDVSTLEITTCTKCNATQRLATCAEHCNVHITIEDPDNSNNSLVLTAFDEVITIMLEKYNQLHNTSVTIDTKQVDHIYEAILLLPPAIVRFRESTRIVTELDFD